MTRLVKDGQGKGDPEGSPLKLGNGLYGHPVALGYLGTAGDASADLKLVRDLRLEICPGVTTRQGVLPVVRLDERRGGDPVVCGNPFSGCALHDKVIIGKELFVHGNPIADSVGVCRAGRDGDGVTGDAGDGAILFLAV